MKLRRLAGLLILAAALPAAAQTAYRWVDKDGRVQFSDQPPPQAVKQFEERKLRPGANDVGQAPYALRKAAADFPVTLYTGQDCGKPCDDGRSLLTRRGVPFTETLIETPEALAAAKARLGGEPAAPTLVVGREKEFGFAAPAWDSLLDKAGYPAGKR